MNSSLMPSPMRCAGLNNAAVECGAFIVASNHHITREDDDVLLRIAGMVGTPVMVAASGYGYLISLMPHCDDEQVASFKEHFTDAGLSSAFLQLWDVVRTNGFGLLQLDRDGDVIDGLPTFDW